MILHTHRTIPGLIAPKSNQTDQIQIHTILIKNKKEGYSRQPRLSDTRYSAKGSAREMEICMQQIGCFRDCTLCSLITFKLMVRFQEFLACRWVLIIRTKYNYDPVYPFKGNGYKKNQEPRDFAELLMGGMNGCGVVRCTQIEFKESKC